MNEKSSTRMRVIPKTNVLNRGRGTAGAIVDPGREAQWREARCTAAAWDDFLRERTWTHCATLTTEAPMTATALRRAFERFQREVARLAVGPVPFFYSVECGERAGRLHVHALLGGTAHLTTRDIASRWQHGHTRVLIYDPSRGATGYVSKDVVRNSDWWDISKRLPPRRDNIPRS